MKRTAVHIATTEGPSEVQRITPEDSDVRSVVCHDGKALALPISPDYDSFVRRPTGVIEACFGHNAYRVDVSQPIGTGLSWQLGLFVAHALLDENRLVRSDVKTPQIVWATGEVTRDLAVEPVDDVDRKIRLSEALIRDHLTNGSRVVVAVPVGNLTEATLALEDIFPEDGKRLNIVAAESVCDVLAALGLKQRRRTRLWLARKPSAKGAGGKLVQRLTYAMSLALLALTVATGWQKFAPPQPVTVAKIHTAGVIPASLRSSPAAGLSAVSLATRAPDGEPCAAVHLERVKPEVTKRPVSDGAPVAGLRIAGLCDFRYQLTNRTGQAVNVWVLAHRDSKTGGAFRIKPFHAAHSLAAGAKISLDARAPRTLSAALTQSFVTLSTPLDPSSGNDAIKALWPRILAATTADELRQSLKDAREKGATVRFLTSEFRP